MARPDRDHECSRSTNDAVPKVQVEVGDVLQAVWLVQHDGQAVDCNAEAHSLISGLGHSATLVICAISRDVDDAPHRSEITPLKQPRAEINCARQRRICCTSGWTPRQLDRETKRVLGLFYSGPR